MKETLTDQIKHIFENGLKWIKLEVEYARLTLTEKVIVLLTALIFGAVCLLLGMIILLLLAFALVDVFSAMMPVWLACLCVCGVILLLLVGLYVCRGPLFESPVSRLISKIILDIKPEKENE